MKLRAHAAGSLRGTIKVPGDKSLSHRALMLASMATGTSRIDGLLESGDVRATARALEALGVPAARDEQGRWIIHGVGVAGLAEADQPLDLDNAGTGCRLLLGILAGHPFVSFMTGDPSLRRRPMGRVIQPLSRMGARFIARSGDRLPLAITGTNSLVPIRYEQPVASAQVKSAVLLAGLHAAGTTTVVEPAPSRDHTERMLAHMGAAVTVEDLADGRRAVSIAGQPELMARDLTVPGDPSSAAFIMTAAALTPGSHVRIEGVCANPLRTGFITCLAEMGASIRQGESGEQGSEPVVWIEVEHGELQGIDVPPERAPSMIDEYPILAMAAALARGRTRLRGLAELRVKESDRLAAVAAGLTAAGVEVEMGEDSLTIEGAGHPPKGGVGINADHDHRIAMSFLVLGGATSAPIEVGGAETIESSFPGFASLMNGLGAAIETLPNQA